MSKMAEKLYDLCLQVAASRHYEADANDIQSHFFETTGHEHDGWVMHQYKTEDVSFWFAFAPDHSGILHADYIMELIELIEQFNEVYIG